MKIKDANTNLLNVLKDEKHVDHALKSEAIRELIMKRGGFDLWKMPICGKCERIAYWHKDGDAKVASCPTCGHITREPLEFGEFYEMGYHVDRAIHPDTPQIVDREKFNQVATVYGGEAGLDPDKQYKIGIKEDGNVL